MAVDWEEPIGSSLLLHMIDVLACPISPPPSPQQLHYNGVLAPVRLAGGLFNQVWAVQGLVAYAAEQRLALSLPAFDSHLHPRSMGLANAPTNKPHRVKFGELLDEDCCFQVAVPI